ncbi:MAG: hypothetical protein KDC05_08400 [Bacteroidales bacterium]|nr:hypothetical protein [Bacteroidales bacterium]
MNRLCEQKDRLKRWGEACLTGRLRYACNDVVAIILVLFSLSSHATIHTVKQDGSGDHTTIQAGIDAASTGDTVLVWPGTYFENIDYNSKNITVASLYLTTQNQYYIPFTIIDGNMSDVAVKIINCTSENTTLCGLTVQHGFAISTSEPAGGVLAKSSYCKIENCIIKKNTGHHGGGISCRNSHMQLSGTIIKENHGILTGGGLSIVSGSEIEFDTTNLNSIFLNYAGQGCDFYKATTDQSVDLVLDTFTVQHPDLFFIYSINDFGFPLNDVSFSCLNHKIEPVPADLYVDPVNGDNSNSGLSELSPLKNIYEALIKIKPDSSVIRKIHLSDGIYSETASSEFLPVNCRSFIEIKGVSMNATILHGELKYPLIKVNVNSEQVSLKNLTLKKGNGTGYLGEISSVYVRTSNFVNMDSLNVVNNNSESFSCSGILFSNCDHVFLKNSIIQENYGENPIRMYNVDEVEKSFRFENCKYINNVPDSNLTVPGMTAIAILGNWDNPGLYKGDIINFLIEHNTCIPDLEWGPGCGPGIGMYNYVETNFINLTLANNIALTDVSAMFNATRNAVGSFYNSIFFNDNVCEICYISASMIDPPGTTNLLFSDIQGGEEGIENPGNYQIINWLNGNIDEDPLWEGGDPFSYELQPGSPCINSGVPMYEPGMNYPYIKEEGGKYVLYLLDGDTVTLPAYDLAGNPRISGGRIDMGAYEWQDTATRVSKFQVSGFRFQVHPNPFVSNVFVSFSTEQQHRVLLEVIDLNGRPVKTIADNRFPSGQYRLIWDGLDDDDFPVKTGTYVVCLYLDERLAGCEKVVKK